VTKTVFEHYVDRKRTMPKDMPLGSVVHLSKAGSHILTSSVVVQSCKLIHMKQTLTNWQLTHMPKCSGENKTQMPILTLNLITGRSVS